ncbi:glutaredoxin family protein [Ammoniphilus oxalaticus]|uniref:glutaredoxin family protein n=1 Tax=Ammoniphilus oxalaticus TaxID=66863 RepID=UPI001FE4A84E|nr:glutaredoxin family protein [Ammoniphilus oxalaticus]
MIVYATNHNPECNILRKFLRDYEIAYELRNCSTHPDYFVDVKAYGFLGVPVTVINGKAIQGLKPDEIIKELEKEKTPGQ